MHRLPHGLMTTYHLLMIWSNEHDCFVNLEGANDNASSNRSETNNVNSNGGRLVIPDESTLSRLVAARLDLPISRSLLERQIKLSIIKRCWEDQLRLKRMLKSFLAIA
jgi:hypothetical protein